MFGLASTNSSLKGINPHKGSSYRKVPAGTGSRLRRRLMDSYANNGGNKMPQIGSLIGGADNSEIKRKTEEKRFKDN